MGIALLHPSYALNERLMDHRPSIMLITCVKLPSPPHKSFAMFSLGCVANFYFEGRYPTTRRVAIHRS